MVRYFKPGDRVELRSGGPKMEVLKYILKHDPVAGNYLSEYEVECVWYNKEGGRKTDVFHQNTLVKVSSNSKIK